MKDFADLCPGCGACKDICPFLAEYGTPDRVLQERPEVSFYCTSCRRCDGVCPQGLAPSAAFFREKRRRVRQNRISSPILRTLDGARRFAKAGHGFPFSYYQGADTVFWPGCGLAANRPGLVRKVRDILSRRLHRPVGLALDCCFDPVYGLGDTETALAALRRIGERLRERGIRRVITGCLNCHKLLSEHLGVECLFVLEALPPEVFEKRRIESVYLHHPCPSSRWKAIRDRTGALVEFMGTDLKSVPACPEPGGESANPPSFFPLGAAATCCGNGGGLGALDPDMADRFLERITGEAAGRTVVTYCTGCQNRFLKQGSEAVHLLECLPGVTPRRTIPTPLAQWANRFFLTLATRVQRGKFPAGIIGTLFGRNVHRARWVFVFLFFAVLPAVAADSTPFLREDFDTLAQWEPLTFPKVKAHSTYTLVKEGGNSILKAESRDSASALVHRRNFNVYKTPHLRWRWRVDQLSDRGDPKEKAGDDYPIRVYVMFPYDPARATLGERLTYGAAKAIYGQYPPHSTLNYVWTGRTITERILQSPYTDRAFIIMLEKGQERVGRWMEESVNVLDDYRKAFGKDPPVTAGLAVMSDTDNAGGIAVAYLDFIEVSDK
mgnify:CR=1 FL=1